MLKEVETLKKLDHPNIIKIIEYYDEKCLFIVFELCTGGELLEKIINSDKGYCESEVAFYI